MRHKHLLIGLAITAVLACFCHAVQAEEPAYKSIWKVDPGICGTDRVSVLSRSSKAFTADRACEVADKIMEELGATEEEHICITIFYHKGHPEIRIIPAKPDSDDAHTLWITVDAKRAQPGDEKLWTPMLREGIHRILKKTIPVESDDPVARR